MDKNMGFFAIEVGTHFWKESVCICYFYMVYFVSENAPDTKQPMIPSTVFTYTRKLELKRRRLRMIYVLNNTKI